MTKQNIENSEELEFAIFCIENVAVKLGGKCADNIQCIDREEQYFE